MWICVGKHYFGGECFDLGVKIDLTSGGKWGMIWGKVSEPNYIALPTSEICGFILPKFSLLKFENCKITLSNSTPQISGTKIYVRGAEK